MFVAQMERVSAWITSTPASQAVQALDGYVPGLQSVHILAVAAVVASSTMLNLRLLGVMCRGVSLDSLGRRMRPALVYGIATLVLSGILLLLAEPERSLTSQVFQLKMVLLVTGCLLASRQHRSIREQGVAWEASGTVPAPARASALALLLVWSSIVFAGRWIAYAQY
jgi:hypothetical protein